ncbi:DUF3597 family protein [Kamptonema cortianum]|nr:DUF3597 family protein [Kamptonema cortianum]
MLVTCAPLMSPSSAPIGASLLAPAGLVLMRQLSMRSAVAWFSGIVVAAPFVVVLDRGAISLEQIVALGIALLFASHLVWVLPSFANQLSKSLTNGGNAQKFAYVALLALGCEIWAQLAFLAFRPLYVWSGLETPLELANYGSGIKVAGQLEMHPLTLAALIASTLAVTARELIKRRTKHQRSAGHEQDDPLSCASQSGKAADSFDIARFGLGRFIIAGCAIATALAGAFDSLLKSLIFFACVTFLPYFASRISAQIMKPTWLAQKIGALPLLILVAFLTLTYSVNAIITYVLRDLFSLRTMDTIVMTTVFASSVMTFVWSLANTGGGKGRSEGDLKSAGAAYRLPPVSDIDASSMQLCLNPESAVGLSIRAAKALSVVVIAYTAMRSDMAMAHHCSFQPGCECLEDPFALAALTSAATSFFMSFLPSRHGVERSSETIEFDFFQPRPKLQSFGEALMFISGMIGFVGLLMGVTWLGLGLLMAIGLFSPALALTIGGPLFTAFVTMGGIGTIGASMGAVAAFIGGASSRHLVESGLAIVTKPLRFVQAKAVQEGLKYIASITPDIRIAQATSPATAILATTLSGSSFADGPAAISPAFGSENRIIERFGSAPDFDTLNWRTSVVDLMKIAGLDHSFEARRALASSLGFSNYIGTAAQNTALHHHLMTSLAGDVSSNLSDNVSR